MTRYYAKWAGNPEGIPEDTVRCVAAKEVRLPRVAMHRQCRQKRGRGPGGLYCRSHAEMKADGRPFLEPEDEVPA